MSGCAAAMDARRYSIGDMVDILDSGADADYLPGAEADDRNLIDRPTVTYGAKNTLPPA